MAQLQYRGGKKYILLRKTARKGDLDNWLTFCEVLNILRVGGRLRAGEVKGTHLRALALIPAWLQLDLRKDNSWPNQQNLGYRRGDFSLSSLGPSIEARCLYKRVNSPNLCDYWKCLSIGHYFTVTLRGWSRNLLLVWLSNCLVEWWLYPFCQFPLSQIKPKRS